jgi:hypothetical protein
MTINSQVVRAKKRPYLVSGKTKEFALLGVASVIELLLTDMPCSIEC